MASSQVCHRCGIKLTDSTAQGYCLSCLIREGLGDGGQGAEEGVRNRFGNYELLEKIGQGGMGVVYRARQINLDRVVAVKLLPFGQFSSAEAVQRFQTEASAAAGLQHPNIVAIHEVGSHQGQHYFSMDFIEGRTLAELVREKPLPAKQAAVYLKTIAEAVHYAHQHGILHRDLKPSNILIDTSDQPRITDFGLAKRLTVDSDLTLTGQVLGSPNFMAPEQAEGRMQAVGPATEVYSLGALLYHLLTRQPPFQADTLTALLKQVSDTEPVPPRLLNPSVPRDLETICLKCLEKEVHRRYPTARELAEDLGRFLEDKPIQARPVNAAGRAWKWCRRQPVRAGLMAALMLVFVFGFSGVVWQWRQTQRANVAAERREYAANIGLVQSLITDQEFDRARQILDVRTPERFRSWEWGWLQRQCHQDLMTFSGDGPLDQRICAAFDPATRLLATDGGPSNTVLLWDLATGQKLRTLVGHSGWVFRAAFSRDGRQLATSSPWDRVARIWDVATGREWRQLEHPDGVPYVAYSPNGKRLATACWDGKVRVWDTERWTVVDESPQYGDQVYCAEFSPDGRRIAYAGGYAFWANSRVTSIRLWDLQSREVRSLEGQGHTQAVTGIAWNPKGDLLASCAYDGHAILWDVASGLLLKRLEPGARTRALLLLRFSPDGHSLAIAGTEFPAHPWAQVLEVPTLRLRYDLVGHSKGICGLAFSHDGQSLATAAFDGMAKVWPAEPVPPYLSLEGHDQPVWAVAFSPNGDSVATGSLDQTAKIWDAKSGALLQTLNVCFPVVSLAFSHRGDRLVSVGPDNSACVWQVRPFPAPRSSRGEEALAAKSEIQSPQSNIDRSLLTSAATADQPLRLQGHTATVMAVAWSPDDRRILTASKDKSARIWDARTGVLRRTLLGHKGSVLAVAFSPKGQLVATGGSDDSIRLWDAVSGQCLRTLTNHQGDVLSLAFSPDGNLLASGGADRKARVWDVKSGRQFHELSAAVNGVTSVAFSPNGTRLAAANSGTDLTKTEGRESRIRLWDVSLGRELLSMVAHPNAVYGLAFSPDGLRLATASGDNTARIWTAFPWRSDDYPGPPELSLSARIENYKRQFHRTALEAHRRGLNLRTEPQLPRHTSVHVVGSFNLPPAGSKTSPRRPIPPRSPQAGPDQLDLTASYNMALNESWLPVERLKEVDLSLTALPSGLQTFDGVRFDVRGFIQLRRGAVDCELFPEGVAIPVRRRFTQLHALHGGRGPEQRGRSVASFVLHYADGTEATLRIVYGEHLRAANPGKDRKGDCPLAQVVWPSPVPADPNDVQPWVYQTALTNPQPALEVERIEYVSQVGRCGPFLVAVTVE